MGRDFFVDDISAEVDRLSGLDQTKEAVQRKLDMATDWQVFAEGPVRFAPVAWQDKVYFVSDDGHLYCLDAGDGSLKWKFRGADATFTLILFGMFIPYQSILIPQYFITGFLGWIGFARIQHRTDACNGGNDIILC